MATADPDRHQALIRRLTLGGGAIGSLEAFLALRGLRTLPVRLGRAGAEADIMPYRASNVPFASPSRATVLA